jgi:uncharacterized protein YegP (UPF0339 family)
MATFQIFKDKSGEYRWRFRAANGLIVATSGEGYVAKADAAWGIEVCKQLMSSATTEDLTAAAAIAA